MNKMSIKLAGALLLCAVPMAVHAQFGGIGKLKSGLGLGGSESSGESVDTEAFLGNAVRSTKNVMISAVALNYALGLKQDKAGAQAEIASISGMQDIKEIGATKTTFASNLSAIADNEHLADDVRARYEKGSAAEKKMLSLAVGNLAIGVARNLVLAKQAPEAVKSVGSNPMLVKRVGQLKLAGELVGMQAKGLSGIATKLPALLSAVKIKAPAAPETTEPQAIVL